MNDITGCGTFAKIEPIDKGWSGDKKYYVENIKGQKFLLRVSDISEYEIKKSEFDIMKRIFSTGIKMSEPVDFGKCNNGKCVYLLLKWCEGNEAKEILPSLSLEEQYAYGCEAGKILKRMEKIEYHSPSPDWDKNYGNKVAGYISAYRNCHKKLFGDDMLLSFLDKHSGCLKQRPASLLHADFQSDNMVISPTKELYIIDFQGSGTVDPYYALTGVMVTAEVSPEFSTGQLHGYFDGDVPDDFWELNAFYTAAESLNAFAVAVTLGQEEIDYANRMMAKTFEWLDNLNRLIPVWYRGFGCDTGGDAGNGENGGRQQSGRQFRR